MFALMNWPPYYKITFYIPDNMLCPELHFDINKAPPAFLWVYSSVLFSIFFNFNLFVDLYLNQIPYK